MARTRDHSPLIEIGEDISQMHEAFEREALQYAAALWLHLSEGARRPVTPYAMHGFQAKAIKEVVMDRWTAERLQMRGRREAA